jgi:hypothetical protein
MTAHLIAGADAPNGRRFGSAALCSIARRGIELIRPARHRTRVAACRPDPFWNAQRAPARPQQFAGALIMDTFVKEVRPLIRLFGTDTAQ